MTASTMKYRCYSSMLVVLWLLVGIVGLPSPVNAQYDIGSATLHAAGDATGDETAPSSVAATTDTPACTSDTQSKMTQFSLQNIELQRRCFHQSSGVNAFPFDVAPSRSQLVCLSTSAACLMVSKAVLRVIERECIMGEMMPVRATAETILKLNEERKTLAKTPLPPEDELRKQIYDRAMMNHARDDNPIDFAADQYPADMQQYEIQLTKAYATGGIILLSADFKVLIDISATEQTGNEAAFAAVAELSESSSSAEHTNSVSSGGTSSDIDDVASLEQGEDTHRGSHGAMRGVTVTKSPLVDSGSLTDNTSKPPSASAPASSSHRSHSHLANAVIVMIGGLLLIE